VVQNVPSILVVEDNRADANLIREALEEYQVQAELVMVSDGEVAINLIHEIDVSAEPCPQLIILDLNLPKRSGAEILQAVRRSEICRNAQVVILSSSDAQQDRAQAEILGANRYIKKPSRLEDFICLGGVFRDMLGGSTL